MIKAKQTLSGSINTVTRQTMSGSLNNSIVKVYPELEDLRIKPSNEEQVFKHPDSYGYDEIFVERVDGDELTIIPTTEEQINEGLFDKIIVEKVTSDIDKNIRPEIIRENEEILGVVGSYKGIDTSDATAASEDILKGKTAYVNGQKIDGTIEGYDGSYSGNASFTSEWESIFISSIDDSLGANVTKLPDSLTSIENYAFHSCTNLRLTELPKGIVSIGQYAFRGCTNLALTELPSGLTNIGTYAFEGCSNLMLTELPDGITKIGGEAFSSCKNITLTKLPKDIVRIENSVFAHCTNLALTDLPSNVTYIGYYSFRYCSNITISKLPEGLTELQNSGFQGCSNITVSEVPSGVTEIRYNIFDGCTKITELTFKGAITNIENGAFKNITNLGKIVFPNIVKVPKLNNKGAFEGSAIANGTGYIYIPDELVEECKVATNWSTYADQIKPISEMEV